MKKQLTFALGVAVLSAPALASNARLTALNQSTQGSFYVNDTRNVFLNPATINSLKDYAILEWGSTVGTNNNQRPEGGFFMGTDALNYGLYFGNTLEFDNGARDIVNGVTANTYLDASNVVNLFIGGDAGVQWGLGAAINSATDSSGAEDNSTTGAGLRFGLNFGEGEAYAHYNILDESDTGTSAQDLENGRLMIGGAYNVMDYKIFGNFTQGTQEIDGGDVRDYERTAITAGVAKHTEFNDKARMVSALEYTQWETDEAVGAVETESKAIPVTVGVEVDAASWLTARASLKQNLWSESGDATQLNSTSVAAGATLHFGNLKLDGVLTNNQSTTGTPVDTIDLGNVLSRVSVSYFF